MNLGVETEVIEFKKTTGELREGIVSIASMLNKNGYGTLYFGIKDNGDVFGQQIGDRTLREVSQAIANYIKPQIIPTITLELLDEKNVIKVYAEGSNSPYSAYGKYYMRSADEDRELFPEQLRALMLRIAEQDHLAKAESNVQQLSFSQLRMMYSAKGLTVNDEHFEENIGIVLENGKYNTMAQLLADKNDVSIKVVTFRGEDKSELIKRNEYGYKCLIVAMDQVLNYIEALNDTNVSVGTHQREEEKLFDMKCFREAWVNACLHTKWEKLNPPAVYVFRDRIEVISTGGLPEDLSVEEFYRGISRPVNIRLQKILGQLGYVEQTGHGIPMIVQMYGRQAFEIFDNYVNVVIPFSLNNQIDPANDACNHPELNDSQRKILRLLGDNAGTTIKELVGKSGLSDGYVRKIINQLKVSNVIERVGSNKKGYWKIKS